MVRRDGPWGCVVPGAAGLVAGLLVGAGLAAWYWAIHWWRAG